MYKRKKTSQSGNRSNAKAQKTGQVTAAPVTEYIGDIDEPLNTGSADAMDQDEDQAAQSQSQSPAQEAQTQTQTQPGPGAVCAGTGVGHGVGAGAAGTAGAVAAVTDTGAGALAGAGASQEAIGKAQVYTFLADVGGKGKDMTAYYSEFLESGIDDFSMLLCVDEHPEALDDIQSLKPMHKKVLLSAIKTAKASGTGTPAVDMDGRCVCLANDPIVLS